ncbi:hypothetical protein IscW_ISCW019354 [Ixodes scapularis]|uniref:Uncharacterized protein n=1 Tax=Ixodes scapularis TaxID=6945 RepID=B7PS57_IXOSC|nr:hypothetical protein IscW_ISCW019354 [Ixodes scapularis]|eukprot:XP_002402009.1 hypothetical protein IscW_ISCW019354 [Ixodes scapularis]
MRSGSKALFCVELRIHYKTIELRAGTRHWSLPRLLLPDSLHLNTRTLPLLQGRLTDIAYMPP